MRRRVIMGRNRQLFIGGIVVAVLGVVGVISYAPERLPETVATLLSSLEAMLPRRLLVICVGVLLVLYSLWRRYTGRSHLQREPLTPVDGDAVSTSNKVGASYTTAVAKATVAARAQTTDDTTVAKPLRTALIDLLVARGWPQEQATDYVETGRWTNNQVVAVFLGTDQAGDYPFWYRVYAWLLPDRALRRRVTASISQLKTYAEAPPGKMHQPPTSPRPNTRQSAPTPDPQAEQTDSQLPSEATNSSPAEQV